MELNEMDKRRLEKEKIREKYKEELDKKYTPLSKRVIKWLGSSLGIFILTMVFIHYIPKYLEYREKQKEKEIAHQVKREEFIRDSIALEQRKAEQAIIKEKKSKQLCREIKTRLDVLASMKGGISIHKTSKIRAAILGSSKEYNEYSTKTLPLLLREVINLSEADPIYYQLEKIILVNEELLTSLNSYILSVTNHGTILSKDAEIKIVDDKYSIKENKQYIKKYSTSPNGETIELKNDEEISRKEIILSEHQKNDIRNTLMIIEKFKSKNLC